MRAETKVALIVGINAYEQSPLTCCVNDACEIEAALALPEYGFDVITILDEDATKNSVLKTLLSIKSKSPDVFLFYFSGHGCSTDFGSFIVTRDANEFDLGIELGVLANILQSFSKVGTKTVAMLDCCHAGGIPWGSVPISRSDVENTLQGIAGSRVVMAACRASEVAYEMEPYGNSAFTHHLVAGMLGEAADRDGNVTALSLYEYASKWFKDDTGQVPVIRTDVEGRILLASGFDPKPTGYIDEGVAEELEAAAVRFLDDYAARASVGFKEWREIGYREACSAFAPVLQWFENRRKELPELCLRKSFNDLRGAAIGRLASLANVDAGTRISVGPKSGLLETKLGDGSFGTVWRVRLDEDEENFLAYKIYHPHELYADDKVSRFRRGYDAMTRLDHPNIVRVHYSTACPIGFFMDYIDGPNLRHFVPVGHDATDVVRMLLDVGDTLVHAHGRDVIHRDIKPENIIVRYKAEELRWVPFLTDFDLAWFSTATKLTKDALGTMFYAAPEQLTNYQSPLAHAKTVDIFSFGQLSFFSVTKSDPVPLGRADNVRALERRIQHWPSGAAAEDFVKLYSDCTEPEPKRRPQSFLEITDRLNAILTRLRDIEKGSVIDDSSFIMEIIFSLSGIQDVAESAYSRTFTSRSSRTSINVNTENMSHDPGHSEGSVVVHFRPAHGGFSVGKNYEETRVILNKRIDAALRSIPAAKRRSGTHGSYEVYVEILGVNRDRAGLDLCRSVISRVIDAMER